MTELDDLIAEQANDDTSFQAPERGTVPLTDPLLAVIESGQPWTWKMRGWPECPLHGRSGMRVGSRGDYLCATCEAAAPRDPVARRRTERASYARNPERKRARVRDYYHRNRDRILARKRSRRSA